MNTADRIPSDFTPSEDVVTRAKLKAPDVNLDNETRRFIAYFSRRTGRGAVRVSWDMAWLNWMRCTQQWIETR